MAALPSRRVIVALALSLLVAEGAIAQLPNAGGGGDQFDVGTGGAPGDQFATQVPWSNDALPSPPGPDRFHGGDPQCGGSWRGVYGPGARVVPEEEANRLRLQGYVGRCASCQKSGPRMLICWPAAGRPIPLEPRPDPTPQQEPPCPPVASAARAARDAIDSGQDPRGAMAALNRAQHCAPPSASLPIDCWDMMVSAQSKRSTDPQFSSQQAARAVACYDGQPNPAIKQAAATARKAYCEAPRRLVCDLKALGQEVFRRYDDTSKRPIGVVPAERMRLTPDGLVAAAPNAERLFLVLLSGVEFNAPSGGDPRPDLGDLAKEWGLQIQGRYRRSVLDVLNKFGPDETTRFIIAGHSLGGLVGLTASADSRLASQGRLVDRVVTYGSPVLESRHGPLTSWVRVEAGGDPALALSAPVRGGRLVKIPGFDLLHAQFDPHQIYGNSGYLQPYDLRGFKPGDLSPTDDDGRDCLCLGATTARFEILDTADDPQPDGGCGPLPQPQQPTLLRTAFAPQQVARWTSDWAKGELRSVAEAIGESAMDQIALHGLPQPYAPLIAPLAASTRPQGFDAVYFDPSTREIVIGEAKGGYNGQSIDQILGCAYGYRQGTINWAIEAAKRVIADRRRPSSDPVELQKREAEVRRAEQVLAVLQGQFPRQPDGQPIVTGIRIEVFHTEHNAGQPGTTRRYVTDRWPAVSSTDAAPPAARDHLMPSPFSDPSRPR